MYLNADQIKFLRWSYHSEFPPVQNHSFHSVLRADLLQMAGMTLWRGRLGPPVIGGKVQGEEGSLLVSLPVPLHCLKPEAQRLPQPPHFICTLLLRWAEGNWERGVLQEISSCLQNFIGEAFYQNNQFLSALLAMPTPKKLSKLGIHTEKLNIICSPGFCWDRIEVFRSVYYDAMFWL